MKRPYIIIKFAKSRDGFIGNPDKQVWLTNEFSKRLVHKWRSEIDSILVGTNTAEIDNPELSTRYNFGKSPVRVVIDKNLRLESNLKLFSGDQPTIVFTMKKSVSNLKGVRFISFKEFSVEKILRELSRLGISSIIIEGGAYTIESLIKKGLWDEARIFTAPVFLLSGIKAPTIPIPVTKKYELESDYLEIIVNPDPTG